MLEHLTEMLLKHIRRTYPVGRMKRETDWVGAGRQRWGVGGLFFVWQSITCKTKRNAGMVPCELLRTSHRRRLD